MNPDFPEESQGNPAVPRLSVIIPVYHGKEPFRRCLQSLFAHLPPSVEVIVVIDGDTSGSAAIAAGFPVTCLESSTRHGPAHARNLGARAAKALLLLFLDADVEVHPETIAEAIRLFQDFPHVDAFLGSYDNDPAEQNFVSQFKNLFHHFTHQNSSENAAAFWSGCGAIRRETFFAFGGFDESFSRASVEDIDLGYRMTGAGHLIRLSKDLQVKHLKKWTTWSLLKSDIRDRAFPWTLLILRHKPRLDHLNLVGRERASVAAVFLSIAWLGIMPFLGLGAEALLLPAILLVGLNYQLYRFFWNRRGLLFTLPAIVYHWAYYLYGGISFVLALLYQGALRVQTRLPFHGGRQAPVRSGEASIDREFGSSRPERVSESAPA